MQKTVRISPRLYINIKKLFIDLINMWKSRQSILIQHGDFCVEHAKIPLFVCYY